jgi:hypothetical protein
VAQRERTTARIEAADDAALLDLVGVERAHLDAELTEHRDEALLARTLPEAMLVAQRVRALLERLEPVATLLEEVGDLVERRVVERERATALPFALLARHVGQEVLELKARVLVEVEERRDRVGDARLGAEAGEIVARERERAQERLVEEAREALVDVNLAEALHEVVELHAEELERLHEERQLQRALARLDQRQVGRRDAELRGHLGLRELAALAQLAELAAHRFGPGRLADL